MRVVRKVSRNENRVEAAGLNLGKSILGGGNSKRGGPEVGMKLPV